MGSATRELTSNGLVPLKRPLARVVPSLLWALVITLVIGGPWLASGYIFGTDWPGPRTFRFPDELSPSAPVGAALAIVSSVVPAEWAGKLLILSSLFCAALLAYWAVPTPNVLARALGSAIYVVNPFVYGRLHYGQIYLVAAYALLPGAAMVVRRFCVAPNKVQAMFVAVTFSAIGAFSVHVLLMATLFAVFQLGSHFLYAPKRREYFGRVVPSLAVTVVAGFVLESYWIVPLVAGRGELASQIGAFSTGDQTAFAAVPDRSLGLMPNLLGLYGFWAENAGRFISMKEFVPLWPFALVGLLLAGSLGAATSLRRHDHEVAPWVAGLVATALVALILEMGVSSPLTSGIVTWLDAHISVYRGMRDAGKWAVLLALLYSQVIALGAAAIVDWIRSRRLGTMRTDWSIGIATALLLALSFYYGNGVLFGLHGEVRASAYPAGWYAADRALASDPHPGRTLFLPWHEYLTLSFVRNQNAVVRTPAPSFFSTQVLASTDPEVSGTAPPTDPDQVVISDLVKAGGQGRWAQVLADHGIKYILLAREVDWQSFEYLDDQAGLVKVGDYGSILLYRNSLAT